MLNQYVKANTSDTAEFHCKSDTTTTWTFNREYIPSNAKIIHKELQDTLIITSVEYRNGGNYTCNGVIDGQCFWAVGVLGVFGEFLECYGYDKFNYQCFSIVLTCMEEKATHIMVL